MALPETDIYVWTDPNGASTDLSTGPAIITLWGVAGDQLMPVAHVEYQVPFQPGAQLRYTRIDPRDVDLPLFVRGSGGNEPTLLTIQRALAATFYPAFGDGLLTVTKTDGSQRALICRYADGLIGHTDMQVAGVGYRLATVVLHARDPFWYAVSPVLNTYTLGNLATFFPFFPLRLTFSTGFADVTINNPGDVEAWPVWTITGPGVAPALQNLTTGTLLSFPGVTLLAGDTLTIDTRPGVKSVLYNNTTNYYGQIAAGGSLWSLARGNNSISLQMTGATVASSMTLSYTPRYVSS